MTLPRRVVHNEYDLQDIAEASGRAIELIERDFALVTLAAHLSEQLPGMLCFKGGFVGVPTAMCASRTGVFCRSLSYPVVE
jgi:hypothetical protein